VGLRKIYRFSGVGGEQSVGTSGDVALKTNDQGLSCKLLFSLDALARSKESVRPDRENLTTPFVHSLHGSGRRNLAGRKP